MRLESQNCNFFHHETIALAKCMLLLSLAYKAGNLRLWKDTKPGQMKDLWRSIKINLIQNDWYFWSLKSQPAGLHHLFPFREWATGGKINWIWSNQNDLHAKFREVGKHSFCVVLHRATQPDLPAFYFE